VGPAVADLAGNLMDQNGDRVNGAADDVFTSQFELALPDLQVVSVAPQAVDVHFGQTINVQWLVRNDGAYGADAAWSDRLWLSSDEVLGGDASLAIVSAAAHRPLAAGGEYAGAASVRIPIDEALPDGTYYLLVQTDASPNLEEANEANNVQSVAIHVTRLPGPAITLMRPADEGRVIDYVDVSFDKEIDPASFTTADVSLTGPGGAVGASGVQHLVNHTYRIAFPRPVVAGAYTLAVGPDITDPLGNRMDQNGDGRNGDGFSGQFEVRLPDLVVDRVTPGWTSACFGEKIPVEWLVRNAGAVLATGSWTDRAWLSLDEALGAGDVPLGTAPAAAHSPLAPGSRPP